MSSSSNLRNAANVKPKTEIKANIIHHRKGFSIISDRSVCFSSIQIVANCRSFVIKLVAFLFLPLPLLPIFSTKLHTCWLFDSSSWLTKWNFFFLLLWAYHFLFLLFSGQMSIRYFDRLFVKDLYLIIVHNCPFLPLQIEIKAFEIRIVNNLQNWPKSNRCWHCVW